VSRLARLHRATLSLYPADYRARYAREAQTTFAEALSDRCGTRNRLTWMLREIVGVGRGALVEWLSKYTTDPMTRGKRLPDCRMMRPVGVRRDEWGAGIDTFASMTGDGTDE